MILAAAIEGKIIFWIFVAVVGAINWLAELLPLAAA